jgi:hypothetical protein
VNPRIDTARALTQWGKWDRAFNAIRRAERYAPEEIRQRAAVHRMIDELARRSPTTLRPHQLCASSSAPPGRLITSEASSNRRNARDGPSASSPHPQRPAFHVYAIEWTAAQIRWYSAPPREAPAWRASSFTGALSMLQRLATCSVARVNDSIVVTQGVDDVFAPHGDHTSEVKVMERMIDLSRETAKWAEGNAVLDMLIGTFIRSTILVFNAATGMGVASMKNSALWFTVRRSGPDFPAQNATKESLGSRQDSKKYDTASGSTCLRGNGLAAGVATGWRRNGVVIALAR